MGEQMQNRMHEHGMHYSAFWSYFNSQSSFTVLQPTVGSCWDVSKISELHYLATRVLSLFKSRATKSQASALDKSKNSRKEQGRGQRSKEGDKKHWLLNKYTAISMHSEQMHSDSLHSFCHAFRKNAIDQFVQNLLCFRNSINLLRASIINVFLVCPLYLSL